MDLLTDELFSVPNTRAVAIVVRLVAAGLLGGLLGAEREAVGKSGGSPDTYAGRPRRGAVCYRACSAGSARATSPDHSRGRRGDWVHRRRNDPETDRPRRNQRTHNSRQHLADSRTGIAAAVGPLWVPVVCAACAWVVLSVLAHLEAESPPSPRVVTGRRQRLAG